MPRIHLDQTLAANASIDLPPDAARHVQVLRLQPGDALTLFNGQGGEWQARIERMGRGDVRVLLHEHVAADRELPHRIVLAIGMPANERMDALVEKATELGAAGIQPLLTERSVLRLSGERAERRVAHWRGVAIAASEQSGRTQVPAIAPVSTLGDWLARLRDPSQSPVATGRRLLLSPRATQVLAAVDGNAVFLSGPEGGLSDAEEQLAIKAGFAALSLGPRVLRADTAPLAALVMISG